MEYFDINFYKKFYEDVRNIENEDLEFHYLENGFNENRFINIKDFENHLSNIKFDYLFYKKFNDLKIIDSDFESVECYKTYLSNKGFMNLKELEVYLDKYIDINFFKSFYNDSDLISIYKKIKNKKKSEILFKNLKHLDAYLQSKNFDIDFYKNFYNSQIRQFKFNNYLINNDEIKDDKGAIDIIDNLNFKEIMKKICINDLKVKKHYIEIGQNVGFYQNEKIFKTNNIEYQELNKKNEKLKKVEAKINSDNKELDKKIVYIEEKHTKLKKLEKELDIKKNKVEIKEKNYTINNDNLNSELKKIEKEIDSKKKNNLEKIIKLKNLKNEISKINDIFNFDLIDSKINILHNKEKSISYKEK